MHHTVRKVTEGSLEVKLPTSSYKMNRWKSRGGKNQRREDKKKEDQKRERVRRQKMQVREKVEKSRFSLFFQCFVAPEGKVGSLKRRVRSHLGRWEMKNCAPLWREADLEVKKLKTLHVLGTFGRCVEMLNKCSPLWCQAHFEVKIVKNTTCSDHLWKLRWWKSARHCGKKMQEARFQVKLFNTPQARSTFGCWDAEKCTPLRRKANFQVKNVKTLHSRAAFGGCDVEKVHALVARSAFPSQKC